MKDMNGLKIKRKMRKRINENIRHSVYLMFGLELVQRGKTNFCSFQLYALWFKRIKRELKG